MAVSYPTGIKTFTTKDPGDPIQSAHINELQDEVVAVETQLGVNAGTWQSYTPTVSYYGGTTETDPTSESIQIARYCRVGKLVHVYVAVSVTRGAGDQKRTVVTLPITGANALGVGTGHENICQASSTPRSVRMGSTEYIIMYHTAMTQDGDVRMAITYEAA